MSDLIERLRAAGWTGRNSLPDMAADEIERLQARVDKLEWCWRNELMDSYQTLTSTRKARYSGPEEYADAIIRSEALEGEGK